jgi:acyl-CoA reductase-like NAD-dependent aldehyde dehydrogenase
MTTQIAGEVIPSDKPNNFAMAIRQPVGVVLGIAPWNAPVILGVRAIAMPLACGNTVVLKASEMCPGTHALIGRSCARPACRRRRQRRHQRAGGRREGGRDADRPSGGAAHQLHRLDQGRRIIAETAARYLKPVLLELGGKAPMVILDDADLDEAVKARRFGCFANMGQICMSTERLIVDEKVADAFVEKFAAKARALPHGDPRGHVILGSLVTQEAATRNKALLDDASPRAQSRGGRQFNGTVVSATVSTRVTPRCASTRRSRSGR